MQSPTAPDGRLKAYQQIADALRVRIDTGQLSHGDKLPNETVLAEEFGVSRATVREALRLLSALDLIRTARGSGGGSYITVPRFERVTDFLHSSINLMSLAEHVSLDELLEARATLEVPAARLAATRRRIHDVERLRATIPATAVKPDPRPEFNVHREFHSAVLESCGNALLAIAAQPVFTVLMTNVRRSQFTLQLGRAIKEQHEDIADAIEAGDADGAGALMAEHLEYLRPHYERAWRRATRP